MNINKVLKSAFLVFSVALMAVFINGCAEKKKEPEKRVVRMKIAEGPVPSKPSHPAKVKEEVSQSKEEGPVKRGAVDIKPQTVAKEKALAQKTAPPQKVVPPVEVKKGVEGKKVETLTPAAKQKEEEKIKEGEPIDVTYVYNPKGRPDPFKPFIKEVKVAVPAEMKGVPLTPLQREDLIQFKVVAIISSGTQRFAMVEDKMGKGYIIKVGTYIGKGGGKVVEILPDKVLVEEQFIDLYGERKINRIALNLRKAIEAGGK